MARNPNISERPAPLAPEINGHQNGAPPTPPHTPRPASTRPKTPRWLPIAAIAGVIFLLWAWHTKQNRAAPAPDKAPAAPAIPTVKVTPVGLGAIVQTLNVTGALKANQNIDLSSKIIGRVARVLVNEGDRVRRGQLLVQLDDADLRAQVAAAQAAVRSAQVRYQQAVVGLPARSQQVTTGIQTAESGVNTAQSRLNQAQQNEPARIKTAQLQVATARETVRTSQARLSQARETARQTDIQTAADVRRAEAAVSQSQAALADIERGARAQQIAAAQAQVTLQEAQLRDAETDLNRQRILVQGGAAAQSALDAAITRTDVARAQVESARQNLSLVREGATTEQIRQGQEAVRQAEAQLNSAQAARARVPVAQQDVTAALAALGQSQAGLQTAVANLAQIPVAREDTQAAREAVLQAQSQLAQARANRSQIPQAQQDVQAAAAAVQQAQAQLQQAQVNLNYAQIYSPVDGVVNQKYADAGQSASPGVTLLNLVSLDRVYFEAQVGEAQIARVKAGQPAQISVPAVSAQLMQGYVTDIIPTADAKLRQFRVRITIPNAPSQLTPGAFARGIVTTQAIQNTLVLPSDTLQQDNNQQVAYVAVPQGGQSVVKRRVVQTGASAGGKVQVLGGLRQGDQVVVGNQSLEDGAKVKTAAA